MLARFAWPLLVVSCAACTAPVESSAVAAHARLVYGDDDRYEVGGPGVDSDLYEAARAVAAIIPRSRVRSAGGTMQLDALSLGEAEQLCDGERFAAQPSVAECSAVLVDDNLLATSGHCFAHALDCQNYLFVFDYFYEDGDEQLGPLIAYECRQTRVRADDPHDRSLRRDYAIVELTERVEDRVPLTLRDEPLAIDEPLIVISTTAGVPLKVDLAARVLDPRSGHDDYFVLESDTFHGSSGAPVLDHDGALVGLFARGQNDYVFDEDAACYRAARVPPVATEAIESDPAAAAEHASFAQAAIDALCAMDYPSERLCGVEPACGDGICSADEDDASCGRDCTAPDERARRVQRVLEVALDGAEPRASDSEAHRASGCSAALRPVASDASAWLCAALLVARSWRASRRPQRRHGP